MTVRGRDPDGIRVLAQDYHRNGVGGAGFIVSLVEWPDAITEGEGTGKFVAVSFFQPEYVGQTYTPAERKEYLRSNTAVLNIADLAEGIVDHALRGADYVGPAVVQTWHDGNCSGERAFIGSYDPFGCGHEKKGVEA